MPFMLISMRNLFLAIIVVVMCSVNSTAQTLDEQIGYLLSDALFYSEKYIVPATDGAVYQASSSWINSAKKREKWQFDLGIHANLFFVPNRDRQFTISNNDFQFLQIENTNSAIVPTAFGNDEQVYLYGNLDNQQIRFKTPEGINQETIVYPYLQARLSLPYGFEVVGRYSTRTKLKKGDYQVYGFGLQHNFSQYFKKLEEKKINLAAIMMYSNEDISFDFLDVPTNYGDLGLNQFTAKINTYHFQIAVSKEINQFEIIASALTNYSTFNYKVSSKTESPINLATTINNKLPQLEKDKWNFMGEISANYYFNDFFLKSSFSFGKFANVNLGLNYTFNFNTKKIE
ncbi:DUF6588 family protein [Flavobacterium sp.]|uniref:DUF6588 family protein n=1 Tax=Flavobacterium sp. TaxID=239 RepID=UPI0035292EE4